MNSWIRLHQDDHVIIALQPFAKGDKLTLHDDNGALELLEDVPKGHKIATREITEGNDVLKFGYSIGKAKVNIAPGSWVHTHNMGTGLKGLVDYTYMPVAAVKALGNDQAKGKDRVATSGNAPDGGHTADDGQAREVSHSVQSIGQSGKQSDVAGNAQHADSRAKQDTERRFQGYVRDNGDVGIRNEIWIINTVGCINKTCEIVAKRASSMYEGRVDGVHHFAHPFGCSQLGDDLTHTQKLLASLVQHPNAAGVLVIGLGCENNQIDSFKEVIGDFNPERIKFLKSQDAEDEIEEALELIEELVEYAERFQRQPVPISRLKLGLKCGGSDGLSGITANPLVGDISDRLIAAGGSAILTEVPEMFGAETILMNRAENEQVFEGIVHLINDFKQYFIRHNQEIYENPSPGNKAGGISTLEEKSLGCTQKGGHAIVTDVVPYGERIKRSGLNLLEAPGNDLVSVTALSAGGAHIVLFTTGRGTPFGGPVPTVKIATNSELATRKRNWIDFDAGRLLEDKSMSDLSDELWEQLIALASGEAQTHNERNGFKEIAIFKDGVIL